MSAGQPVVRSADVDGRFVLSGLPALSRSTVDCREELRTDVDRLRETWPAARLVAVDSHGRTPMIHAPGGFALDWRSTTDLGPEPLETAVLLGEENGRYFWASRFDTEEPAPSGRPGWSSDTALADVELGSSAGWLDLRTAGSLLGDTEAGLFTSAVAVLNWHRQARFCVVCGGQTRPVKFGWAQVCAGCGREEYPRTDAATICLVHDEEGRNGEHILLARQPIWPPGRYSVLAGFVEAGESLEVCVAREIEEEVGVVAHDVRYLGSQPWPFPRSLMIGFAAVADRAAPLHPAAGEIEDPRWVHRDEVRAALAHTGESLFTANGRGGQPPTDLLLPGMVSIAGRMISSWAATP